MRLEVRRLVAEARGCRVLPLRCWVGEPGGAPDEDCVRLPEVSAGRETAGLRVDLVERAIDGLERTDGALAWLTRSGDLYAGDEELAWWSAVRTGFARHGLQPVACCLVNRFGWVDLDSGQGRTWKRVRVS